MAPSRSVKISAAVETVPQKTLRRRQNKAKSFKVPSAITISVPMKTDNLDVLDTERKVDLNTKISLANEVVRAQLLKEPVAVRLQTTPLVRKEGRKKTETVFKRNKSIVTDVKARGPKSSTSPKKKTKRGPTKAPVLKKINTRKRKADPTKQKSNTKRRKASEAINLQDNDNEENLQSKNNVQENIALDILGQSPMVVIPTKKRKLCRGKQNINASQGKAIKNRPSKGSPKPPSTILSESQSISCKSPILQASTILRPTRSNTQVKDAAHVASRKTSTSSISNLSWTHDISSSSSTTCITVSSNDFVRFDKKMPIIKLHKTTAKQIDSSLSEPTVQAKVITNNETYSSETEVSCVSSVTDSNSLLEVNTLKLSSSSENSIKMKVNDHKTNFNRKDYTKAAANLVRALELIDMEFINWIHDPDYISADLNKLKDKLFDILNNEFSALKYCRNLQEMLKNAKSDSNIVGGSNNTNISEAGTDHVIVENIIGKATENPLNTPDDNNLCTIKAVSDSIENKALENEEDKISEEETLKNKKENGKIESEDDVIESGTSGDLSDELHNRHSLVYDPGNTSPKSEDLQADCELRMSPPYSSHDDGDTISLYAESLTGLESSKLNTSAVSIAVEKETEEEYVPEPVQRVSTNYDYYPTKIMGQIEKVIKTVCEKQHADSTSVYKETNSLSPIQKDLNQFREANKSADMHTDNKSSSPIYNDTDLNPVIYKEPNINGHSYQNDKCSSPKENQKTNSKYLLCKETNVNSLIYNEPMGSPPIHKESAGIVDNEIHKETLTRYVRDIGTNQMFSPKSANKPMLITDIYGNLKQKAVNIIFNGYCYFNIIDACRADQFNKICKFSHHIPDSNEIRTSLSELNLELFIQEYMLIRRKDKMMTKYGLCFVQECVERHLTRILVEMAFDFVKYHQINNALKVEIVEITLLYLNNIDLSECEDLLRMPVTCDQLLCEKFMQVMSSTQNFSRFKPVFLSLTYLIVNIDRMFSLDVAQHILERVCILPFDESTFRALIQIMRLTNPQIFMNSMIVQFEKQICGKRELFEEYLALKKYVTFGDRTLFSMAPVTHSGGHNSYQHMTPKVTVKEDSLPEMREGLPSPDTTHLDLMNKTTEDVMVPITRTISGLNVTTRSPDVGYSPNSSTSEEVTLNPKEWRHKNIFKHIFGPTRRQVHQPLQIRAPNRQMNNYRHGDRLVTFGGNSSNYAPRRANY